MSAVFLDDLEIISISKQDHQNGNDNKANVALIFNFYVKKSKKRRKMAIKKFQHMQYVPVNPERHSQL